MIVELRSLLPALEEEESPRGPVKSAPGEKREAEEAPLVEAELRSADLSQVLPSSLPPPSPPSPLPSPSRGNVSFPVFLPESGLQPERSPFSAAEETGGAFRDDRIPELLERLLDAAERSAVFSERIADLMERQGAASTPVYA